MVHCLGKSEESLRFPLGNSAHLLTHGIYSYSKPVILLILLTQELSPLAIFSPRGLENLKTLSKGERSTLLERIRNEREREVKRETKRERDRLDRV